MPEAIITSTFIIVATSSTVTASTSLTIAASTTFTITAPTFSPSPPPPPSPTTRATAANEQHCRRSGDFESWVNIITTVNPRSLPLSATVFMPEIAVVSRLPVADPFLLPCHVVPQRLNFADLRLFKNNSRLPTFLPGKFIVGDEDLAEVVEVQVGGGAVEVEVDLVGDGC